MLRHRLVVGFGAAALAVALNSHADTAEAEVSTAVQGTASTAQAKPSAGRVISAPRGTSNRSDRDAPKVELITGGNSTDGAARVGALPILD